MTRISTPRRENLRGKLQRRVIPVSKGEKQSFKDFTNQKQLRLTEDQNYPVQHLSGDASTDNRQDQTENIANTAAMNVLYADSGLFMHPMHDVTQTNHVNGDKVLQALQVELDELELEFDNSTGAIDPNEQQNQQNRPM